MHFIVTISRSQERIDSPIDLQDSPKSTIDSPIECQDSPKNMSDSPIDSSIEDADSPNVEELILALLQSNPTLSTQKIAMQLDIHKRTVLNYIDALKTQGRLQRIGPSRGGIGNFQKLSNSLFFNEKINQL